MSEIKKQNLLHIFTYILIFAVFMGSSFFKFTLFGVNFNFSRTIMLVMAIVFLANTIIKACYHKRYSIKVKDKSIKYCIVFFIIWSIYSALSIYKVLDFEMYLITNFFVCIGTICILFFVNHIDIEENKNIIFNMIIIPVFINCLYYLYLYYIKDIDLGGFYYNINDLATVLTLAIPISLYQIFHKKNILVKIIYLIVGAVYMFCFINIMSRACILGVICALIIFSILVLLKNRKEILQDKKKRLLLVLGLIIVMILCIVLGSYIWKRYIGRISLTPIENARTSNEIRVNLIYNGLHFLQEDYNWLLGIGTGNNCYYLENNSIYTTSQIYNFHNFALDLLVEYGVIIFIGFIITYFIICKELYKSSSEKLLKEINAIFLFFLIVFVIASISSSTIITREWIWITFAIIFAYINSDMKKIEERYIDIK